MVRRALGWIQMILCTADLSALNPATVDPRKVGLRAALENFVAFLEADCVKRGYFSQEDAARGFDQFMAEMDALLSGSEG
jgi:hypothetical protein